MTAKVAISETGMVISGISVVLNFAKDVCYKNDQRKGYDQRFDNAGNRGADIIG